MPLDDSLSTFELPPEFVRPVLEACRLFNTSLDTLFYDVPTLAVDLKRDGETVATAGESGGPGRLDLGALSNPEGALLVVDAAAAPHVRAFHDVTAFLADPDPATRAPAVATITGVGSSALGSAALAWNVSQALGEPVLAIVPGYGVADALLQALGGWFGFGLHDALDAKSNLQIFLAAAGPRTASIGRRLSASAPGAERLANGGPVFRTGGGSSDVLHAVMLDRPLRRVVGHSKGALSIANALAGLPAERTKDLDVVTLGCPVAEDAPGARYHQFLGLYDALGALNSWGHPPDDWTPTAHGTNTTLPLSMHARDLVAREAATG